MQYTAQVPNTVFSQSFQSIFVLPPLIFGSGIHETAYPYGLRTGCDDAFDDAMMQSDHGALPIILQTAPRVHPSRIHTTAPV
eukprot:9017937-Pyramimonas_sp.AAC.1